ncbi:hypothetical protein MCOR27_005625 [Pyricularia oryzae]|uniref:Glycoside hydrolase family 92 protein n=1 Tax=Pyricularia grisea TaxID=148305 RepID=A0ABQ8N6Q9_PYRGI|nr:hypothetical protein MCOR02_006038 [Pyricularia oryzae]KAI6292165.1 hypothetical protein MCOR33_010058 [Pyricularia grisea]KAI6260611.1 hypothetical protein MCOR19_003080 [Pyricularia oryzae]KAI6278467.1 hypothetical protein MCOR27_005625 [Pyricularia oryzae]KAI6279023.1 hypothetical protein MCOR26_004399 [Pyricularia oryzae]
MAPSGKNSTGSSAPISLRSSPRRVRLLLTLTASLCVLYFFLLPSDPQSFQGVDNKRYPASSRESGNSHPTGAFADGEILKFVDPLIGTVNGGHVFPGATLPYGMVKAVADTNSHAENAAGFVSDDSKVTGFSHLHDSGTGGNPSLGNFPLWIHPGCPGDDFTKCSFPASSRGVGRVNGSARATPGYFSIELENSVRAEMTTTERAALYRFSFPDGGIGGSKRWSITPDGKRVAVPFSPLILLDVVDLGNSRTGGGTQVYADEGSSAARMVGDGKFLPSFGTGNYRAYVCADVRGAKIRRYGTFQGPDSAEEPKFIDSIYSGGSAGSWVQFDPPTAGGAIVARVGVSFMSVDQACANAEAEIPTFDFDGTFRAAQDSWREKLSVVEVDATGVGEDMQTTFWSGLYRSLISPQNYTGENPLWDSSEPYYDSFYCIWDSFRAQHPLLTIIDPIAQTEMVRALLDIYRNVGKLPDCRMSFSKGFSQGGSNADVVIVDAYVKKLRKDIDWATAYEAVVSDAEDEPQSWGVEGRGNLESYHRLGYIPVDDVDKNGTGPSSRQISRLVEYAYEDFCISLLAKALGHSEDAEKYHKRGGNWKNIWREEQADIMREVHAGELTLSPFTGFMQPKRLDGSWKYHNVRLCSPKTAFHSCYLDTRHSTYEGSSWLYSFFVPQDMAELIQHMGGPQTFVKRLEYWHEEVAYMGNEQAFLPVFQFHYGGRPDLSSYWAHRYIPSQFNASINGIPGNDDSSMGAFAAMVFMGFFPVAGQDVYLITPPFFREVRIQATGPEAKRAGRKAIIRVRNFDPTYEKKYIESATLNGQAYTKNWITHDFFREGGLLELTVSQRPVGTWGTGKDDLPPSYPVGERDDITDPSLIPRTEVPAKGGQSLPHQEH